MLLTRRTNVLLTDNDYLLLKRLSRLQKVTIASLIRDAIRKAHGKREKLSLAEMFKEAHRLTKGVRLTHAEIKEFINEGRKY